MVHQLQGKPVFFIYLLIAPAARPVKFGDHGHVVFDADLIDAVFIGIECNQAQVAAQALGLHAIDHGIGCQRVIRMSHWHVRYGKRQHNPVAGRGSGSGGLRKAPGIDPGRTR